MTTIPTLRAMHVVSKTYNELLSSGEGRFIWSLLHRQEQARAALVLTAEADQGYASRLDDFGWNTRKHAKVGCAWHSI